MVDTIKRGGFRVGSGRKKGEGSTIVRVPNGVLFEVRQVIDRHKASPEPPKASPEPPEPPKASPEPPEPPKASKSLPFRLASDDIEDSTKNPFYDWKAKPMSSQKRSKAKALRKKKRKK